MSHNPGSDNGAVYGSNTFTASGSTSSVGAQVVTTSSQSPYQAVNWMGYNSSGYAADAGTITPFAGSSVPDGWLLADGSCVSRTTYSRLFANIGTAYGAGDGVTTFCLPDLRGRLPLGAGTASRGATGGARDATPSANFAGFTPTFTVAAHTFSWPIPGHSHNDAMYKDYTCCDMSTDGANMTAVQEWAANYYTWNYAQTSTDGAQTVTSNVSSQTVSPATAYGAKSVALPAINPRYQTINYLIAADPGVIVSSSYLPTEMRYDPSAGSQDSAPEVITLTNSSGQNWPTATIKLRYRWLNEDGTAFSNSGDISLGATDVAAGTSREVAVTVQPPILPAAVMRGRFTLRFDLYDTTCGCYFRRQRQPAARPDDHGDARAGRRART